MSELKPCKICNSPNVKYIDSIHSIYCSGCDTAFCRDGFKKERTLVADWNKPAPDIEKAVDKIAEIEAKLQTAIEGAIDDTISIYSNVLLSDLLKVKSLLTEGGESGQ